MKIRFVWIAFVTILAGQLALATPFLQTIGNTNSANGTGGFTDGSQVTSGVIMGADLGNPSPFNGATCGTDASANCSTSFTFSGYGPIPGGQSITSATITLGVLDLDTHAAGNQVGSFIVAGVDLTAALNTAAELGSGDCVGSGMGCYNNIYQILTIPITSGAFAQMLTGSTTVSFASQSPGWGVLGPTTNNGVFLDFSTLSITTDGGGGTSATPEPGTLLSLSLGMLGLAAYGLRRRRS